MKVNTQYMHSIWFNIKVKDETSREDVIHGHYGRILNQTVVVVPTIHVHNKREVIGFCFTPQDGNSLLSSITAIEHLLYPEEYKDKIKVLSPFLFNEV